ncbi:DUF4397 domain-containing protein [Peribacillus alkalitolerans]|uniref:DUF4397 domain-containing protein n=1 Tax=Peribacillus alkalitolerans TaxID=1550385 RepID=UPI0013D37734|nr:DUF4397 domain-containing protein [Peribacillus alkalitolerans]
MTSRKPEEYFEKASMYGMLADYYKSSNPELHMEYYQKHIKNLQKAAEIYQYRRVNQRNGMEARIRALHAVPDGPNVDVFVNGTKILKDFPYKKMTDYLPLPQGSYHIDVYPTGDSVNTIISRRITVEAGKSYTLAAIGSVATKNLTLQTIEDSPITPTGESKVRFAHLSPDAPGVDIAVKGGDVVFPNVTYRKVTDYLGITPMKVDLEARVAGTNNVVLSIPGVSFQPGTAYTIYAIGLANGTPGLEAIILSP